jgi:hypothetical protein
VNVDSTADWVNDFGHKHLLNNIFEEAGRDWMLTLKNE